MKIYCAECGNGVAPDSDHVRLSVDIKRMSDRDDKEAYAFHTDCWRQVSAEWLEPA